MSKSHVTVEQQRCIVCCKDFDTGALLLDMKLRERFERNTLTGMGLCPEHLKMHEDGYISFVEIDPEKSKLTGKENKVSWEGAHRTGRMMHMKRERVDNYIQDVPEKELERPFMFIDIKTFDHIAEQYEKGIKTHLMLMAWAWCDENDKSTEFMFPFIADFAEVEEDEVVDFVTECSEEFRNGWYKANPEWEAEFSGIQEERIKNMESLTNDDDNSK